MFNTNFLHSSFRFWDGFLTSKVPKYKYFPHHGYITFCGEQGSGKSLSAHKLIKELLQSYPGLRVVSNTPLSYCDYIPYDGPKTIDNDSLNHPDDDGEPHKGYILFLDEITNMFTSLDSKNISDDWFDLLNMQRKRELLTISTAPVLSRQPKNFRELLDTVCVCSNPFGTFQLNHWYKANVDTIAFAESMDDVRQGLRLLRKQFFFHSLDDYNRYDTSALVHRNNHIKELQRR